MAVMPLLWGMFAGLALTAWIYEPPAVRRIGEYAGMAGVLVYLVVGVVAAENLLVWLQALPDWLGRALFSLVKGFHELNPFGVVRYWFTSGPGGRRRRRPVRPGQRPGAAGDGRRVRPRGDPPGGPFPRFALPADRLVAAGRIQPDRRSAAGLVGGQAGDGVLGADQFVACRRVSPACTPRTSWPGTTGRRGWAGWCSNCSSGGAGPAPWPPAWSSWRPSRRCSSSACGTRPRRTAAGGWNSCC